MTFDLHREALSDSIPPPSGRDSRFALVTGASRGIGAEVAVRLARAGWTVGVNYAREVHAANDIVARIEQAGGRAYALRADVADEAQVMAMFARIDRDVGRIDALVNNAGVVSPKGEVATMTVARLQRVFAINVVGAFICAREAIRRMSPHNAGSGGAIVNVSSAAARLGGSNEYVDYAASKGAIDTFTVGLARELAMQRIRVNAIRPGLIETDIHASGGQPGRVAAMREAIPMRRAGQPDEVAAAICWLLSDEASYVTGAILDVSGGR